MPKKKQLQYCGQPKETERGIIIEELQSLFIGDELDGDVLVIANVMKSYYDDAVEKYLGYHILKVYIETDLYNTSPYSNDPEPIATLFMQRYETDTEWEARVEKAKVERAKKRSTKKEEKIIKDAKDRKEYERLKKKFESDD